jgi:hypothetical protein
MRDERRFTTRVRKLAQACGIGTRSVAPDLASPYYFRKSLLLW